MTLMHVDKEAIRALADLLKETGLSEIEVAEGESRIRIARPCEGAVSFAPAAPAIPQPAPAPAVADRSAHPGVIKSPIVGVAYLTPDPASPPFAKAGERVEAGQTLLLIEAMKTFNQIKAPKSGVLLEYCVDSGEPVEFGTLLAIIE